MNTIDGLNPEFNSNQIPVAVTAQEVVSCLLEDAYELMVLLELDDIWHPSWPCHFPSSPFNALLNKDLAKKYEALGTNWLDLRSKNLSSAAVAIWEPLWKIIISSHDVLWLELCRDGLDQHHIVHFIQDALDWLKNFPNGDIKIAKEELERRYFLYRGWKTRHRRAA